MRNTPRVGRRFHNSRLHKTCPFPNKRRMSHSVADNFLGNGHQASKKLESARILRGVWDWAQSRYSNVMAGVEKIQSSFEWSANRKLSGFDGGISPAKSACRK